MESLPNASQFSPVQTPLLPLLQLVRDNEPDRTALTEAIRLRFFPKSADPQIPRNTVIALGEYQIVQQGASHTEISLSDLGRSLLAKGEAGDTEAMHLDLARHIYLYLHGKAVADVASDIAQSGRTPTKALIVKELKPRGIYHPPNGTHANGIRQWFEQAGLVEPGKWVANPERLARMLGGTTAEALDAYSTLTKEQRDFARAFARLDVAEARSNDVARYATSLFGTEFPEGGLPQSVLFALQDAGLIAAIKTTAGSGAKPYLVRPTALLQRDLIEPLFDSIEASAGAEYRSLIRMRYADILTGLDSASTHQKGLALEALAFHLARLLGLQFVRWRLRSAKTNGGEVGIVMEGAHLIFSRWQIQCKNAAQASLEDIAQEVGIAQVVKANVILIVTTGRIGAAAREFAQQVMRQTNLYVALLEKRELTRLRTNPAEIAALIAIQAEGAMAIKRGQMINP